MARTRVGVVGCGGVSEGAYLPNLAASAAVQVEAVCDVDPERARRAAQRHGVARAFTDVDAMLARADFELLVNLTPMPLHAPINRKGLRAGRHVWCEKPIATSLADGAALLEEAERRGLGLYGAPNCVLSPTFRAAAKVVGGGEIGKVCAARAKYGHGGPHAEWFYKAGGGALFDLGVYNVTTLTGLLGPARGVVALSGVARPRRTVAGAEITVEADDNTMLLLDFGDARFGSIMTGFVYPPEHDRRATIELLGTGGAVSWLGHDFAPRGIEVSRAGATGWETRATDQEGYHWSCGASYVAECLASGTRPAMTGPHAYHVLEVMLAALDAARTARYVPVRSSFPWPVYGEA